MSWSYWDAYALIGLVVALIGWLGTHAWITGSRLMARRIEQALREDRKGEEQ